MGTTALSTLIQRTAQQLDDWIEVLVTTAIAANNSIISTNLKQYDGGQDDYFNNWWVYITDKANAGVLRQVSDYATATGTLTVYGSALTTDGANLATIDVFRYSRNFYLNALNDASREIYPDLHRRLDDITLVTGNILPNSAFKDWASTAIPDFWGVTNAAAVANTTSTYLRGAKKNVKVTASAANGSMYVDSLAYPRLLDLMGHTVTFKAWAYPEVANDAKIEIYTLTADSTAQTLTSTTTNPAGKWTLLELENQGINDELSFISIRLKVTTNAKYVYFENARLTGRDITEYLLPQDFQDGALNQVYIQESGSADDWCDDIHPIFEDEPLHSCKIIDDGTDKFLNTGVILSSKKLLRLIGKIPLETLSAATDTVSISGKELNLLVAYAKYKLFQQKVGIPASMDVSRYQGMLADAYGEYMRLLPHLKMASPQITMRLPSL